MKCKAKHTKYQPVDWVCPVCGAKEGHLIIECPANNSLDECVLLHVDDQIQCHACNTPFSGQSFSLKMEKIENTE